MSLPTRQLHSLEGARLAHSHDVKKGLDIEEWAIPRHTYGLARGTCDHHQYAPGPMRM